MNYSNGQSETGVCIVKRKINDVLQTIYKKIAGKKRRDNHSNTLAKEEEGREVAFRIEEKKWTL